MPLNINKKRPYEVSVFILIAIVSIAIAIRVGNIVVLSTFYGIQKVIEGGLDIVKMPKGKPWVLSNGNLLQADVSGMWFGIVGMSWLLIAFVFYITVDFFLWGETKKRARKNVQALPPKKEGRIVVVGAVHSLLFFVVWIVGCALLLCLSKAFFNSLCFIILIAGWSFVLFFCYLRYVSRSLLSIVAKTKCPSCGAFPMEYQERNTIESLPKLSCKKCGDEIQLRI